MLIRTCTLGYCAGALLCLVLAALPARPASSGGTWTVQAENDRIANTDRHYTHGTRFGWVSDARDGQEQPMIRDVLQFLYPLANVRKGRAGFALGHNIYTPEDTEARNLERNDRPYAGWLYLAASLHSETEAVSTAVKWRQLDTVELEVGMVGPAALGKEVQNSYHELIGVATSKGWSHQLENEPGVALIGERKWRHRPLSYMGFEADVIPHIGASVGNVYTAINGGGTVRFGQRLGVDFGPPLIRPSLSGLGAVEPVDGLAWYIFAGLDGRAVARNIFLDGNTFASSHSVDKKPLVGDFILGAAVVYGDYRVAFTHVMRTREFDAQRESDRFGSISLSARF